jgi:hypothetical protein
MPITTIDKQTTIQIRTLIDQALAQVAAQHGLVIKAGRAKYTSSNVVFELTASVVGDGGVVQTPERVSYERNCTIYGLNREWLDKTVLVGGKRYKITGLRTKSSKDPVLVTEVATGKALRLQVIALTRNAASII